MGHSTGWLSEGNANLHFPPEGESAPSAQGQRNRSPAGCSAIAHQFYPGGNGSEAINLESKEGPRLWSPQANSSPTRLLL